MILVKSYFSKEELQMKIFMTGGTGNIGQYVMQAFLNAGHSIVLLTRTPDRIPAYRDMPGITLVPGNILDFDLLRKTVQGCDAVVHIALGWGNDPVSMLENDTKVTACLLDAAEQAGVRKFIYTSSTAAVGNMQDGTNEDSVCRPTDLYGATKASGEAYTLGFRQYYSQQGGYGEKVKLQRNVIRPGYTYSNPAVPCGGSQSDRRFARICEDILAGRDISLDINDGTQFLSARQIAQVYLKLLESDMNEEVFFALGANFVSWYEIACMAKEMVPKSGSRISSPTTEGKHPLYDVSKIKKYFGLEFDSREDLKEHIRWNLERANMFFQIFPGIEFQSKVFFYLAYVVERMFSFRCR